MARKITWEEHVEDFREVHGDRYKYPVEQVLEKGTHTKVKIVCEDHGEFEQRINSHKNGHGCPECANQKRWDTRGRLTTDDFVAKSREVHGEKYEYHSVEYISRMDKVEIICKEHGSFWQTPNGHLGGKGCPKCGGTAKRTVEDFIQGAKETHGDVYDYREVKYKNGASKVEIRCPSHGSFWQTPNSHLSGIGCPKCGGTVKRTVEEFIQVAKETHGDVYDYHKVDYKNNATKVEIKCTLHGSFWQTPNKHLSGQGCPDCAKENYQWNINSAWGISGYYGTSEPSNIYILKMDNSFIKVGLAKEIHYRMNRLNKESGYSVEKLYSISGKANELFKLEQKILRYSGLNRYYPEVSFAGQSECLELSELPKVLEIIKEFEETLDSTPELYETEPTQTEQENQQ